jgi:hypothetical protein
MELNKLFPFSVFKICQPSQIWKSFCNKIEVFGQFLYRQIQRKVYRGIENNILDFNLKYFKPDLKNPEYSV